MELKRDQLLKTVKLLQPAVATVAYIPAHMHLRLQHDSITAFNDVAGIVINRQEAGSLGLCVPGEQLMRALSTMSTDTVTLVEKDGVLLIRSGRSTVKLPTLPVKDFHMPIPATPSGGRNVVDITDDILDGIRMCLQFASTGNKAHVSTLGVTLDAVDGKAVIYSTDDVSMSRFATETALDLDEAILLPPFFCDQLLALTKAYGGAYQLEFHSRVLIAHIDTAATLICKTLLDAVPLDFNRVIARHVDLSRMDRELRDLPDGLDAVLQRAVSITGANRTHVEIDGPVLRLKSGGDAGLVEDELVLDRPPKRDDGEFIMNPALVLRAAKVCDRIAITEDALVLGNKDASFLHLIAYQSR